MKIIILFVCIFIGLVLLWTKQVHYRGIKLHKIYNLQNPLYSGFLDENTEIQGMKLKAKTTVLFYPPKVKNLHVGFLLEKILWMYKEGQLESATLAEDIEIQGVKFSEGQELRFYENGKVLATSIPKDKDVEGIKFLPDTMVTFHKNGKVNFGYLAEDTYIQGMRLMARKMVIFHENGKIEHGFLAEDTEIQGTKYEANTEVSFDEGGKIRLP